MAGDWIKFELNTLDKPEVCQIADLADIDPDAAVGKLMRVWGWFDQQTEKGNAPSVSKKLLDRLVGVTGFCEHMKSVHWMVEEGGMISLPHFDRHNGKTAKNRLLTAKRVANHKSGNAKGNAPVVSDALPKEDVDVEKKEDQKPMPTAKEPSAADDLFAKFWALYPKKKDKDKARKAWGKLKVTDSLFTLIIQGLGRQVVSVDWTKLDGQYVPLPTTWLNGKRWDDEIAPASNVHQFPRRQANGPDFDDTSWRTATDDDL